MRTLLKFMSAGGYTPPTPPPPPVLWTPANLANVALWIDAADSSTVTLNGSTVSQINDKSGNNRHAVQATSASQPTYTTGGLNSRNVLTFDGTDDQLEITNALSMIRNVSYAGSWTVASISTIVGVKVLFFYATSGAATSLFYSFLTGDVPTIGGRRLFANGFASLTGAAVAANSPYIHGGELHFGAATSYLALDGNTPSSAVFQTAGNSQDTDTSFTPRIGALASNANYMSGFIAEQILVVGADRPTTDDISRIEGYLAHKWGLVSSLPVSHPYKSTAPTV